MGDKGADDRDGTRDDLARLQQHAAVLGEGAMSGDAAEEHAEVDARGHRCAGTDTDGGKADVVGCFENSHSPAAVEGDIEFARQAIQLAVVQNVMVHLATQQPCIDQLLRVDPG